MGGFSGSAVAPPKAKQGVVVHLNNNAGNIPMNRLWWPAFRCRFLRPIPGRPAGSWPRGSLVPCAPSPGEPFTSGLGVFFASGLGTSLVSSPGELFNSGLGVFFASGPGTLLVSSPGELFTSGLGVFIAFGLGTSIVSSPGVLFTAGRGISLTLTPAHPVPRPLIPASHAPL